MSAHQPGLPHHGLDDGAARLLYSSITVPVYTFNMPVYNQLLTRTSLLLAVQEGSGFELGSCRDLAGSCAVGAAVDVRYYAGAKHEVIFEQWPDMDRGYNRVVDDIVDWLKGQVALQVKG